MQTIHATRNDADMICTLMHEAFAEYRNATPPSSALKETPDTIAEGFDAGEQAIIAFKSGQAVGVIRFRELEDHIYFYRLSVPPSHQGKGVAKQLIHALETYTQSVGYGEIRCRVRASVSRNMHLYEKLHYVTKKIEAKEVNHRTIDVATLSKSLV
ncbi:GNAT family N-acetyltransferase [Geomicrobium sp. JCM 19039]|uniref:GNAT family N-acetyltransferase n=1 Tax=Geomicrobium sp. JCM 19039 TaxID=1460636 RepID=UPI00045F43C7|nr:GNAT family N-acetyltransferase [Geomicrobium sp. JCM 19039]GAK14192.1 hypothetical protein JCM19039_4092 [Geomicrobium sp. JCM 19039]